MKNRIAMISYHTCPLASEEGKETGGMNIYVLHTAKALAAIGYSVDIFTRAQDATQPKIVQLSETLRVIHVTAGPERYMLPDSDENKRALLTYLPDFVTNIQAFQKEHAVMYDVLDCHYYLSGLAGLALQKDTPNLPLIMTFHTLALMKNLIARNGLSFEEKERITAELQLVQSAQAIISPSENEKRYLQYLYNAPLEKIHVIAPGVDTSLFRPLDKSKARETIGVSPDHKMILFVGRIEPVKGIDVLLYAMKILLQQHPTLRVCLWIVGGDIAQPQALWSSELQKLDQLRELLALTTTVKFVGQQPQHMLPFYYNASDLMVTPSHYESFGMTALEAIACDIPVITTNVTGISGLIDDRCKEFITTANNPLLLAEQMAEVLLRPQGKKVLQNIADFDWHQVGARIATVIVACFT